MSKTVLLIGGGLLAVLLGGIAWWWMNSWERLVFLTAKWARQRNYTGLLRFVVTVANIQAGLCHVVTRFLGVAGQTELASQPQAAGREINWSDLPAEFQAGGDFEMQLES